jgi:hypothetical protein
MYLSRLSDGSVDLVQGAVQLRYPAPAASRTAGYGTLDYWLDSLRALARGAASLAPLSLSLRIRLDAEGSLRACLTSLAEAHHEAAVRRWLAGYTRLERLIPESSDLPAAREAFDALLAIDGAEWRIARTSAPDYRRNDIWVACNFRLLPHLGDLLLEARQLGHPVLAQLNVASYEPSDDHAREARRNVVRLGSSGRAPATLMTLQEQLARQLNDASFVVEEFIGSTARGVEEWLRPALARRFEREFRGLPFDTPNHLFAPAPHVAGLDPPMHTVLTDPDGPDLAQLCATAGDAQTLERVLGWVPPDALRFTPPESGSEERRIAPNVLPPDLPPPDARGDFVFVSYAHSDAARIAPHLDALHGAQVPFWYDAGIPSGSEWDAVIETHIERCRALVLFLSPRAAASKYVRREVKFADALDKPLLSVVLEPVALREGLHMLLTQYQMLDASRADLPAALRQALA